MKNSIILFILLLSFGWQTKAQGVKTQPNIIFILADDMGYADVGVYGQELIKTPAIDQMAAGGMTFTDFYAGSTVCSPSRCVLMTGLHTGHTIIRGNSTFMGGDPGKKGERVIYRTKLNDDTYTVGKMMQDAGYKTGLVGKWHLGGYDISATPLQRGFDEFYGWPLSISFRQSHSRWPDMIYANGQVEAIEKNSGGKKELYHTQLYTQYAIDFINRNKDNGQPFVLFLCLTDPHSPLIDSGDDTYADKQWSENNKKYATMVHEVDKSVGEIKKHLLKEGLADNTILIFTSDNGPRSNREQTYVDVANFFNSNGELKGYKADLYEGGIRVPMVVWSPQLISAGSVNKTAYYFADVMATFADIAGHKPDKQTDGISFYPALLEDEKPEDRYLYWEFDYKGFGQAVRYGKWKAVVHNFKLELYDLSKDISEENNVAKDNPDIVKQINVYLENCRTESPYWPVSIGNYN